MASDFLTRFLPHARRASAATGIDPRIILSQAALESGFGKKAPGNNFFGIKSHGKSGGQKFTTHEVINGKRIKIKDSFRKYASPGQSFDGYADFINKNKRYGDLKNAKGLDAQIAALQKSGYATDPNYGKKIRSIAAKINPGSPLLAIQNVTTPKVKEAMQARPFNPIDIQPYQDTQRQKGLFGLDRDKWLALAAGFGNSDSPGEGAGRAAQIMMQNDRLYGDKNDQARKEHEQKQQMAQALSSIPLSEQEKQLLSILPPNQQAAYIQKKLSASAPTPPASIREYEFAKSQGFQGSFEDWKLQSKKAGATSLTVNTGNNSVAVPEYSKLPAGLVYKRGPDGQIIVGPDGVPETAILPNSNQASDAAKLEEAQRVKQEATARSGNVVIEDIDRALAGLDEGMLPTSGLMGGTLANVPGTQAHDVSKLIQTIKANSGFDRLQAMRDSSPTGGALGAINQSEMGLLQSALGNLEQSQSEDQLKYNLERVRRIYDGIVNGPQAGGEAVPTPEPNVDDLVKKYGG